MIVIAGPDGVGKSTLSKALTERLDSDRPVFRFHQRPSVLPTRTNEPVPPHRLPPYGPILSACKAGYLFADFWLGWWIRVRPILRQGGWVIIERGWWDVTVDALRYRIVLPEALLATLARLAPQPDALVVLEVPITELPGRKAELAGEELERQARAWRALQTRTRRIFLDGTRPVSENVGRLLSEVGS